MLCLGVLFGGCELVLVLLLVGLFVFFGVEVGGRSGLSAELIKLRWWWGQKDFIKGRSLQS